MAGLHGIQAASHLAGFLRQHGLMPPFLLDFGWLDFLAGRPDPCLLVLLLLACLA